MTTTTVNVHREPHGVYIGRMAGDSYRGTQLLNPYRGLFGNPFQVGRDGNRDEVIAKYEEWLLHSSAAEAVRQALPELRGKILGCHCKPAACHGDVLARLADREPS